ncbi:hypothetical protein H6G74_00520 [Nostoc spongiaeforme FACHB-130]|uniref:Uncharacterized protein n=1 Tax=Nostoc spongiaeforme FACHB-130 TaxID=1357510 RepID=A0ABR8FRF1_9NOSO|nr:hypothetical protein [Nostoc spongiaeforme FACHB-130]
MQKLCRKDFRCSLRQPIIMGEYYRYRTYADSTISWRSTLREAACASNATWRFDKLSFLRIFA